MPAVVSFIAHSADTTADGLTFPEACKRLEEAGADVVGLNCGRGPKTMMPLMKEIRKVCKVIFCRSLLTNRFCKCIFITVGHTDHDNEYSCILL